MQGGIYVKAHEVSLHSLSSHTLIILDVYDWGIRRIEGKCHFCYNIMRHSLGYVHNTKELNGLDEL